jgi:excisionase family DNA binding protein
LVRDHIPTDLITVAEAARLIGVDRQTVYNMCKDGRLEPWKPPGFRQTWVSRAEVLRVGTPRRERPDHNRASEAG